MESSINGRSSEKTGNLLEVTEQDCGVLTCRGRRVLVPSPASHSDDREGSPVLHRVLQLSVRDDELRGKARGKQLAG